MGRVETAYTPAGPPKPAPAVAPTAALLPLRRRRPRPRRRLRLPSPRRAGGCGAAAKPPARAAATPVPSDIDLADDDLLRQTQTMRAISVAKSIDDISSSMAETLFGDAELDLMAAALASAAGESPDDADAVPTPSRASPRHDRRDRKPPRPPPKADDDPFDLFGLGDDAPLELIDDSTLPPAESIAQDRRSLSAGARAQLLRRARFACARRARRPLPFAFSSSSLRS